MPRRQSRKNPSKSATAKEHLYKACVLLKESLEVKGWTEAHKARLRRAMTMAARAGVIVDSISSGE